MDGHEYSVGEVASAAGVSVRALHHYDHVGLVVPSRRDAAGHRRYDDSDVDRLQRVLAYRALDFDLASIAEILARPPGSSADLLAEQLETLNHRIATLQRVAETLERTMNADKVGVHLTPAEMLEVFGDFDPGAFASEVEDRWGDTDAFAESTRRTRSYDQETWQRIGAEGEAAAQAMLAAFTAGLPADSRDAVDGALAHRAHIDRWFYPCSAEMQCGLADMYLADERFTATYEAYAPGFAQYVHDAIYAAALRDA